ncbi:hypothetical protein AV530_004291 [Patagioenas fasciata monilis]|uniref:Uncharacterized protein n=1 Tax=Patagioenas fasciata monilis TaxID=372326 RepID=A0A1V4K8W4_PATFA|nr:hypothetical protein AV530_004291 [Patagioenas fasciata monilis]
MLRGVVCTVPLGYELTKMAKDRHVSGKELVPFSAHEYLGDLLLHITELSLIPNPTKSRGDSACRTDLAAAPCRQSFTGTGTVTSLRTRSNAVQRLLSFSTLHIMVDMFCQDWDIRVKASKLKWIYKTRRFICTYTFTRHPNGV